MRSLRAAVAALLVATPLALAGFAPPAGASTTTTTTTTHGPLPDRTECVYAQEVAGPETHQLGCAGVSDEVGEYPDAWVCVSDGALGVLLFWYPPQLNLACAYTHGEQGPFRLVEAPGVCVGALGNWPISCVNDFKPPKNNYCFFWVSSTALCEAA